MSNYEYMLKYKWENSLLFPFPVSGKKSKFYLGAAHGLIGALYMLLSTIKFYPELMKNQCYLNFYYANFAIYVFKQLISIIQIFGASSRIAVWDAKEATEKLIKEEKNK